MSAPRQALDLVHRAINVKLPPALHLELFIEGERTGQTTGEVIADAWAFYKAHHPQPWRKETGRK